MQYEDMNSTTRCTERDILELDVSYLERELADVIHPDPRFRAALLNSEFEQLQQLSTLFIFRTTDSPTSWMP